MAAAATTIVYALAIFFDFIPKLKTGQKKECWIYGIMMAASYVLLLVVSLGYMPPSPWKPVLDLAGRLIGIESA